MIYLLGIAFCGLFVGIIFSIFMQHYPVALKKDWRQQCEYFLQHPPIISSSQMSRFLWDSVSIEYANCLPLKFFFSVTNLFWSGLLAFLLCVNFFLFGYTIQAWCNVVLLSGLLLLAGIDYKHLLLPDNLTLPLIWIGLLYNTFENFFFLQQAIWGAVSGYLGLRILNVVFYAARGREGLGLGDCKLFAIFGAWWGYMCLPYIIFLASVLGLLVAGVKVMFNLQPHDQKFSFGPYLVFSGLVIMFLNAW